MKLHFKVGNLIYSGLLIQPNLAFCRRTDSFSTGKCYDHIARNAGLPLNFRCVKSQAIRISADLELEFRLLKGSPNVCFDHRLFECPISIQKASRCPLIIIEWSFVLPLSLEHTTQ
jgi:hypothetical protein